MIQAKIEGRDIESENVFTDRRISFHIFPYTSECLTPFVSPYFFSIIVLKIVERETVRYSLQLLLFSPVVVLSLISHFSSNAFVSYRRTNIKTVN